MKVHRRSSMPTNYTSSFHINSHQSSNQGYSNYCQAVRDDRFS